MRAKAKADRAAARASASTPNNTSASATSAPPIASTSTPPIAPDDSSIQEPTPSDAIHEDSDNPVLPMLAPTIVAPSIETAKEPPVNRMELLHLNHDLVSKFIKLIVPILGDVYAASVIFHVRTKAMTSLLKAISFLDGEELRNALKVGDRSKSRKPPLMKYPFLGYINCKSHRLDCLIS
jgi:E3 ubiquitin-protein ligase TRIP12